MSNTVKKKKTILVTGGAGFIGSHLIDALLKQNHRVICLDNLYTGSLDNLQHVAHLIRWIEYDVTNPFMFSDEEIDEIYHLASPASPKFYQKDPIMTLKTNVLGALNVLELARKHKAKVLLTSTSEVYGDPKVHPQNEQYYGHVNPNGIRACYDEGKRCAETLFSDFHRKHGVEVRIARIFNTFGPRMRYDDGRVVTAFISQALQNKPLTIFGDGGQTRSFCYVEDLIRGLMLLMEKGDHTPVNLGNPYEITIKQLAELISELCDVPIEMAYEKIPEDDPKRRKPAIEKAEENLGWKPQVSVKQGLKCTIDYLASELKSICEQVNSATS